MSALGIVKIFPKPGSSANRARDDETAEAAERHAADHEQEQHLSRHERHSGQPDRLAKRRPVAGPYEAEPRYQHEDSDQRPHSSLEESLDNERAADIGERRPDELHDFNFVTPRQSRQ